MTGEAVDKEYTTAVTFSDAKTCESWIGGEGREGGHRLDSRALRLEHDGNSLFGYFGNQR
jgi:hypothetical protein